MRSKESAEVLPLGGDEQRVSAAQRPLRGTAEDEVVPRAVNILALRHRFGIKGLNCGARVPEHLHDDARGRLAHVVGVGLEGPPPEHEALAGEIYSRCGYQQETTP